MSDTNDVRPILGLCKMIGTIEHYRRFHGNYDMVIWDGLVSQYCKEHCWAMARAGDIYHADRCYVGDWKEAVAMMSYTGEEGHGMCAKLIWDVLGPSESHRNVILRSQELAYGLVLHNYRWYLTIRGR